MEYGFTMKDQTRYGLLEGERSEPPGENNEPALALNILHELDVDEPEKAIEAVSQFLPVSFVCVLAIAEF